MQVTFLGTGTSQGIPVIGCDCKVCQSDSPKDKRLRCSVLIQIGDKNIVIDIGPDFRQQMLRANVSDLHAILITHEHNDHIIGLDDVRPFNFKQKRDMPIFAERRVLEELKIRFSYAFAENKYPGAPTIQPIEIKKGKNFEAAGIEIEPIEIEHGNLPILGFRVGDFAYLTDMKTISEKEIKKIKGINTLVINALHHYKHHSHLNLEEALAMVERIAPKRAFFTHMSHYMGLHGEINAQLPEHISLAYDGLVLEM